MSKQATGQVLHNAHGYSVRVRIGSGPNDRVVFALVGVRTREQVAARAALVSDLAKRLRTASTPRQEIAVLIEETAAAKTDKDVAECTAFAEAILRGETRKVASAKAPTFEDFAAEWTDGKLHKAHPDHVREKDPTRDLGALRMYINPVIGSTRIADVTLEHAERVLAKLPAELAPRTRKLVCQCMRKVLSLAVYPGRYLPSNPIPREWMPKVPKSANKAKSCLYPTEDAKLLRCVDVPLERRMVYGILAREGMRASELERLRWRDVDLEHGRVRLDANKTDDPRAWALSPDVVRTLAWWKEEAGGEADDLVIRVDLANGAWWLRGSLTDPDKHPGDLRTADVTRAELFERSRTRQPIRLHDLRATFVTVSLANGKTEQWVTDRTGHKSSQMIATYTRQARTWAETRLGVLGALDALLPEVGPDSNGHRMGIDQRCGWDLNPRMTVLQTVA
jgi:integrase